MQYHAWRVVTFFVQRLPISVCYRLGTAGGVLAFYLWPGMQRRLLRNYRHVLGPLPRAEMRRVARASLSNYGHYLVDFVRFPAASPAEVLRNVHWDGALCQLDEVLARGRGAVIVSMHFGNWDAGAGAVAAAGYRLSVVAETFADKRLDAMVVSARERLGMRVLKMERLGPSLYRGLRQNGLLALLIDRPVPGEGVRVPFFGRDVEVPAGPARLAIKSGAAVIPVAFLRERPGSPNVRALADFSIQFEPSGDEERDVHCLTARIMACHEQIIRKHPEQWYMFREMWPRAGVAAP